jgi:hypothetical protein
MPIRKGRKGSTSYALFDVTDTSVGGVLCVHEDDKTTIHWSRRVFFATNKTCSLTEQSKRLYGALMELTTLFCPGGYEGIPPLLSCYTRHATILFPCTPVVLHRHCARNPYRTKASTHYTRHA